MKWFEDLIISTETLLQNLKKLFFWFLIILKCWIYLIKKNYNEINMVDKNIKFLCVHVLDHEILVGRVLVLEEELEHLLLVVDVPDVEDGSEVPEEGQGWQGSERIIVR